jgi:hypothetical protein
VHVCVCVCVCVGVVNMIIFISCISYHFIVVEHSRGSVVEVQTAAALLDKLSED